MMRKKDGRERKIMKKRNRNDGRKYNTKGNKKTKEDKVEKEKH